MRSEVHTVPHNDVKFRNVLIMTLYSICMRKTERIQVTHSQFLVMGHLVDESDGSGGVQVSSHFRQLPTEWCTF